MADPTESDLLVEFERLHIPEHYKLFYVPKRHNLFATIQQFPYIWNCFMHLDKIVLREFEAMQRLRDLGLVLPMALLMNAHAKIRLAFELACGTPEQGRLEIVAFGNNSCVSAFGRLGCGSLHTRSEGTSNTVCVAC